MTWGRRVLTLVVLLVGGLTFPLGGVAHAACEGDPPIPARPGPYEPRIVNEGDPFAGDASLPSVYGYSPHVWSYDNGCSPGSDIMPGVGSALANMAFEISGALVGWTHALLEAVISPEWAAPLDGPVTSATEAVARGTWTPWLTAALLIVGILVLFRSRSGHVGGAITAAVWALLVLVTVSWMVSYPTEAVRTVDGTVRSAVVQIGDGFTGDTTTGGTDEERALNSVDGQIGAVVETVQYRMWTKAVFGDPDSAAAREYGPRAFEATHFSWAEWETYQQDPDGAGEELREEKQERFEEVAEQIEDADPAAYQYFTGNEWGSRITQGGLAVVVMAIVCAFLLVAGLTVLAAFVVIRLLVPFAPGLGVLFLLDVARERAIDMFRRVGGLLVMGPLYFVASLVLLKFYGAILTSSMPFLLQLTFIIAMSVVAWQLLKPAAAALRPGTTAARKHLHRWARHMPKSGKQGQDDSPSAGQQAQGAGSQNGPGAQQRQHPVYSDQTATNAYPPGLAASPGTFVDRTHPGVVTVESLDDTDDVPVRARGMASRGRRPLAADARVPARAVPAPSDSSLENSAPATVYTASEVPPVSPRSDAEPPRQASFRPSPPSAAESVNEANLTYDAEGNRVFVVYTPSEASP